MSDFRCEGDTAAYARLTGQLPPQRPAHQRSRQAIKPPLDGFVEPGAVAAVDSMNATKKKRGPRRPPKSASELAEQFHALQQLRRRVQDLEQSATKTGQPPEPRGANENRRSK